MNRVLRATVKSARRIYHLRALARCVRTYFWPNGFSGLGDTEQFRHTTEKRVFLLVPGAAQKPDRIKRVPAGIRLSVHRTGRVIGDDHVHQDILQ